MSAQSIDQLLKQYEELRERYQAVGGGAFDEADRQNALISYSYHTNAIEGNTFTYAQTYDFLKTGQVIPGKSFKEHAEHHDLVQAWNLMSSFARDKVPVSEGMILAIHKQVLATSNPEHAGRYREVAVRVGQDTTPYPAKAKEMMKQMVSSFSTFEKQHHPLVAGAKLHLDTVIIHPFRDGNGRTSRLLLDYLLLKHEHPNVLLKLKDKQTYFQAIRDSKSQRDHAPFARFIIGQASQSLITKIDLLNKQAMDEKKKTSMKPESDTAKHQKKKAEAFDIWDWQAETLDI